MRRARSQKRDRPRCRGCVASSRASWLSQLRPAALGERTAENYCLEIAVPRPRSKYFCILPVAVFGKSFTNETQLGALKWARLSRANCTISASVAVLPGRSTTNACAASPHLGCGMPTTETSCTASWRSNTLSTSTDEMFSPPLMITSLNRSRISTYPSKCTTAASPV